MRELGSRTRELDALEGQNLGESIEVLIAVENGQPAVLGGGRGDQGVRRRHPLLTIAPLSQVAERRHRGVSDSAIVTQDAQRVELGLKRDEF
jgi:hypothetical protein